MATVQEQNTAYWYAWERRGRGWNVYDIPVQLEAPLEEFMLPSQTEQPFVDYGRVESLSSLVRKGISSVFQKKKAEEPEKKKPTYSYPENPVPFSTDSELCCFQVSLPKGHEISFIEAEKLLHMLSYSYTSFSFEIIGTAQVIVVQWTCRHEDRERLISQLKAFWPTIAIKEVPAYTLPLDERKDIAIADLGLCNEFMLPLETVNKFSLDPLLGVFAALDSLRYGECGILQILFQGTQNSWAGVVMDMVGEKEASFFYDMPQLPILAQEKVFEPLYGVLVRVAGQSATKEQSAHIAGQIVQSVFAATKSHNNALTLLPNTGYPYEKHLEALFERTSYRIGMILNAKELATLVHIPSASIQTPKLARQNVKSKPLPYPLQDGYFALGYNEHLGEEQIAWLTFEQRLRHMYVIGATGTGKSTLLKNLFLQDCDKGLGCIMLDPHGDLIHDVIEQLPEDRLKDVILIDSSDTEYPIGLNLLTAETELEKIFLASDLVETFKEQSAVWGDSINSILQNAINGFLESSRNCTLLELRKFLIDEKFRKSILETIEDPTVLSYWQYEFPQLRKGSVAPLLTRLDTFLRPKLIRNMFAQSEGLDFKKILEEKKIVLIQLSQGLIGEENSYVLGSLLLSKVYQAAQSRQALPKEERSPTFLYIDEFHHFLTPSLNAILSGARKYGLGLVLAHQELGQLQYNTILNSVLSNPAIRVCFRVGDTDAQKLARGFSFFDEHDLQNLGTGEAIVRVGQNDHDFNIYTGTPGGEDIRKENIEIVRDITRAAYARPKAEIEALVNELFKVEPFVPKEKIKPQKKDEQPPKEAIEVPQEVIAEELPKPATDLEESAQKFIEATEKQKEFREHTYLQTFIKKLGEEFAFKVELEAPATDGGRIDALLKRNELTIAVEISVTNTAEYEYRNLEKCSKGGYSHIVMVSDTISHLRAIQTLTKERNPGISEKITFMASQEFAGYLNKFRERSAPEKRVRGYRVVSTFEEAGTDQDTSLINSTILNSLKREN